MCSKHLLLLFILAVLMHGNAQANLASVPAVDYAATVQMAADNNVESRLDKKMAKKMAKLEKKLAKKAEAVDFTHPVDKWLWFAIFGFGIAILIGIFFWELGSIFALASLVCLIVWIVKKSGA